LIRILANDSAPNRHRTHWLKSTALIAKSWTFFSQRELFETFNVGNINSQEADRLQLPRLLFLASKPHLASHVRTLSITNDIIVSGVNLNLWLPTVFSHVAEINIFTLFEHDGSPHTWIPAYSFTFLERFPYLDDMHMTFLDLQPTIEGRVAVYVTKPEILCPGVHRMPGAWACLHSLLVTWARVRRLVTGSVRHAQVCTGSAHSLGIVPV
jgi:hypothetical protein